MTITSTKKGLFQRLKDTPPQTAADVDAEIQAVQVEIAEFGRQREAIKTQISDNWGDDSQSAEDEYQRLGLRLEAAQTVIARLQKERIEARKREIVALAAENMAKRVILNDEDKVLYADIQRLEAELKAAKEARHQNATQQSWNSAQESQWINQMNELGVSRDAAYQMFYAAHEALKAKSNGKQR